MSVYVTWKTAFLLANQNGVIFHVYLTIRPVTGKGYGSIAHEVKPKLANASWRNIYLGIKQKKASRFSLLEDYY